MAYIDFDSSCACGGFLIVRDQGNPWNEADTALIQVDYDYPGVAASIGWAPCHSETDGTVACSTCGRTASELIADALDYIVAREGETFEALDVYLPERD